LSNGLWDNFEPVDVQQPAAQPPAPIGQQPVGRLSFRWTELSLITPLCRQLLAALVDAPAR